MNAAPDSKILLVDDNLDNHLAVRAALEGLESQVVCVSSGKKALRILLEDDFAVILLDVNMPEMDGFEVAEHIKKIQRLRQVPILFLSAERQEEAEVFKGYLTGALDYLFTPINPQLLRAKVHSLIMLHQLNQAVRTQASDLLATNERLRAEIGERQQAELSLRAAKEQLEQSRARAEQGSRAKSEFLAMMSHELRTPLNAIIGFSEFLLIGKQEPLTPGQSEHVGTILESGRHLLALINDVLDLAKVESGRKELTPEPFPIREALREVQSIVKAAACKKRIQVRDNVSDEIVEVTLDLRLFKQVLFNLLANAIKFNREDGCVDVAVLPGPAPDRFLLTVTDTGIGIQTEDLPKLFREFKQLDSSDTRYHEGTGLGLALCRKLVELHGGSISVRSQFGEGSTFTVEWPLVTPSNRKNHHEF